MVDTIRTDNSRVIALLQQRIEELEQQLKTAKQDSERYQRLAVLVNAGEWFTGYSTVKDSYGSCDETNMDDKKMMDEYLDKTEVIELAESWARIEYANNLEGK